MKRTDEEIEAELDRRFSIASGPVVKINPALASAPPKGMLEPKISIGIGLLGGKKRAGQKGPIKERNGNT